MTTSSFYHQLRQRWQQGSSICIGLDPEYQRLPDRLKQGHSLADAIFAFNREIIDATHDLVCAYKPNSGFYEGMGEEGIHALYQTTEYLRTNYPAIPIILDAKRADNSNTNRGYVASAFDRLGVDAITVHPYMGKEALAPFLARPDKGIIVLVKTSNSGSGEFQDLPVGEKGEPLYQVVARQVAQHWNTAGNCGLVVGATYPDELRQVRAIVGDLPLLIPGLGSQGGDVQATVQAGHDSKGQGMILNSSRAIIYASSGNDFAQAARTATLALAAEINGAPV